MMTWAQVQFQDAASPLMEEFLFFHDFALVILLAILSVVGYMLGVALVGRSVNTGLLQGQLIEGLWTAIPALVLVQIAVPSLLLLYSLDDSADCHLSLKAVGHQWYWSYEYLGLEGPEGKAGEFDSYMAPQEKGQVRLLDVDNRVVAPWGSAVRVLVGSTDVLHSWTIPSMGIKADACPGRLNQLKLLSHRPGVYYGQCSEICGANHSFMPIALEVVSPKDFLGWLETAL